MLQKGEKEIWGEKKMSVVGGNEWWIVLNVYICKQTVDACLFVLYQHRAGWLL